MDFEKFRKETLKVKNKRQISITGSYGLLQAYPDYKKLIGKNSNYKISSQQFSQIINAIHGLFVQNLINGEDVKLPQNMGTLEVRKKISNVQIKEGKIKINYPVDWQATLKLWYEDEEARLNKTVVRVESKEVFRVFYNRTTAKYNNKSFYQFNTARSLKLRLKQTIKEGDLDAFVLK